MYLSREKKCYKGFVLLTETGKHLSGVCIYLENRGGIYEKISSRYSP